MRFGWKQDKFNDDVPLDMTGLQNENALDMFLKRELPSVVEALETFKGSYEEILSRDDVPFDGDHVWCAITECLKGVE